MNNERQSNEPDKLARGLSSLIAGLNPMTSITFVLALGITALAAWRWLSQSADPQPHFPFYGTIAVSYAGGFLIGRVFWRVIKTVAVISAVALGGLALLNRAHLDTSKAKEAAETGSIWVRNQVGATEHYLARWLPSGGAAGVGVFVGGRRRNMENGRRRNVPTNPELENPNG